MALQGTQPMGLPELERKEDLSSWHVRCLEADGLYRGHAWERQEAAKAQLRLAVHRCDAVRRKIREWQHNTVVPGHEEYVDVHGYVHPAQEAANWSDVDGEGLPDVATLSHIIISLILHFPVQREKSKALKTLRNVQQGGRPVGTYLTMVGDLIRKTPATKDDPSSLFAAIQGLSNVANLRSERTLNPQHHHHHHHHR